MYKTDNKTYLTVDELADVQGVTPFIIEGLFQTCRVHKITHEGKSHYCLADVEWWMSDVMLSDFIGMDCNYWGEK